MSSVFCYKHLSTILENSLFCASTLGGGMVRVLIKIVIFTAAISVLNVTIKVTPSLHLVLRCKTNCFPKWWIGGCNRTPTMYRVIRVIQEHPSCCERLLVAKGLILSSQLLDRGHLSSRILYGAVFDTV